MEITTPIEVLAKSTEESLRQKNAEFLAKYPTDDAQVDYYTQLAMQVFEKFEIDGEFAEAGVRKNVSVWFESKKAQMNLFRRHPYWNEEAKAIVFSQNEKRLVDMRQAWVHLSDMIIYTKKALHDVDYDNVVMGIYKTLDRLIHEDQRGSTITERFIEIFSTKVDVKSLPKAIKRMLVVGTKITKFVYKCFTVWTKTDGEVVNATTLVDEHEEGDRSYLSFDKYYAKFADCLSELTIKKITLLSLHFCDFMTMSNGNSWASCHFINSHNLFHEDGANSYSGCYKQGCLSYALDEPSFLLYTLPGDYTDEEYYMQQKINRMCCQYQNGVIITGKCYPNNEDLYITRYRQTIQLIISSIEDIPNLWTFSRKTSKISTFAKTKSGAAHYEDYTYDSQKPTISLNKHIGIDLDNEILIGHKAYCVYCGDELSSCDHEWLQCRTHRIKRVCSKCGRRVDDDEDFHVIDGKGYCEDCCFYCHEHDEWELDDEGRNYITLVNGEEVAVCDDALDDYFCCPTCGKYDRDYRGYCGEDGALYCEHCYSEDVMNTIKDSKIRVIKKESYDRGDYVLMGARGMIRRCGWGYCDDMITHYSGRVARVTSRTLKSGGELTVGRSDHFTWDTSCIIGQIVGLELDERALGKTLEELKNEY